MSNYFPLWSIYFFSFSADYKWCRRYGSWIWNVLKQETVSGFPLRVRADFKLSVNESGLHGDILEYVDSVRQVRLRWRWISKPEKFMGVSTPETTYRPITSRQRCLRPVLSGHTRRRGEKPAFGPPLRYTWCCTQLYARTGSFRHCHTIWQELHLLLPRPPFQKAL